MAEEAALATPPRSADAESGGRKVVSHKNHSSRCRTCVFCGCSAIVTLAVVAVVILVLALTVYRVRSPEMKVNSITILRGPAGGSNTKVVVDASVKNPNPVAYYFDNSTTWFYYRGLALGVASGQSGKAGARRTYRSNVTMTVRTEQVTSMVLNGGPISDTVPIDSATKVGGHVKILGLVKRHVDVGLNCTVTVAIVNFTIVDQNCWRRIWM